MITSTDLRIVFIILYDNNPNAYNDAFTNAGYSVPYGANEAKKFVTGKMYDLYISNPNLLKKIIGSVGWNYSAGNYTTQGDVQAKVMQYLQNSLPASTSRFNWSDISGVLFGNHDTIATQVSTTPVSSGTGTWAIIGYVFLGIMVVVLVFVAIRFLR